MADRKLLDASCRVALAAFLHDLGKFAERARIKEAETRDADGNSRRDINVQLYCPHFDRRPTHIHAAYTAIALDLVEQHFPELVGEDMAPFSPWKDKNADDSLINAAAAHHRPDTFLQWIIATADRVASGFEREEFEKYNAAADETPTGKNHYTARQLTLFEQIRLNDDAGPVQFTWRYPLRPLSPKSIFPDKAERCETNDRTAAQHEYGELWSQFVESLKDIPASHRTHLALWLDHFDSLWQCFTQAIPAATAFNVKPEVSLYDHSKTTAALAVALWRYHHDRQDERETVRRAMKGRTDWNEKKIMLVQGDFSGIQEFIFAAGGETQRRAAKLLRGRSFYVSLLTECAALRVLEELSLPPTSQVVNAAGKFLIVAPNTDSTITKLTRAQTELDAWFLTHTYGQSGIGLTWLPTACDDFLHGQKDASPFRNLMTRLFEQLDEVKLKRFRLCGNSPAPAVFSGFLDSFDNEKGACAIDGRSPAVLRLEGEREIWVSELARDQVMTGKWLATQDRLLVSREPITPLNEGMTLNRLVLPVFGYHVLFTHPQDITGRFGDEARSGNLIRAWDFSLPDSWDEPLWSGYARRSINAYVPRFGEMNAWELSRYADIKNGEDFDPHPQEIKTFNHLARDDRILRDDDSFAGVEALMTLKGDVDNLGLIFQKGLERPTFAKMAALSRQMNAFFTVWLPWACAHYEEDGMKPFQNGYTVFAGGDDFFLIGPWHSTIRLASTMRREFNRYVAGNPDIHFSAGLSMTKPGFPIRHLARLAEEALDNAKDHNPTQRMPAPKNAVSAYGICATWNEFEELMECEQTLARFTIDLGLSTGYLYDLLAYTDMAGKVGERPENALWHSRFAYQTRRLLEAKIKSDDDPKGAEAKRRQLQSELAAAIASAGIEKHRIAYKIALFTHLYRQRD